MFLKSLNKQSGLWGFLHHLILSCSFTIRSACWCVCVCVWGSGWRCHSHIVTQGVSTGVKAVFAHSRFPQSVTKVTASYEKNNFVTHTHPHGLCECDCVCVCVCGCWLYLKPFQTINCCVLMQRFESWSACQLTGNCIMKPIDRDCVTYEQQGCRTQRDLILMRLFTVCENVTGEGLMEGGGWAAASPAEGAAVQSWKLHSLDYIYIYIYIYVCVCVCVS